MDLRDICYKKTSLVQVIIRVDFLEFLENELLYNGRVENVLLPHYPKKGKQQIIRFQTMNITQDSEGTKAENSSRDGIQQEFANSDNNKIILSNRFIVLELNKFTKYEYEMAKFIPIMREILSDANPTSLRTGIRYINIYDESTIKPQKSYFSLPAQAFVDPKYTDEKSLSTRAMAMNEYIFDDMRLNYRYGLHNPNYPQLMKKLSFVMDYDCFCEEPVTGIDGIINHINKGHDAIQKLFEDSITEKLRKVMGNG